MGRSIKIYIRESIKIFYLVFNFYFCAVNELIFDMSNMKSKIRFSNLYFKKSRNKRGEVIFISAQKNSEEQDCIILANPRNCEITEEGRYDVECFPIKTGRGWFVCSAKKFLDSVEIEENWEKGIVRVLINGKENKLKKLDKEGKDRYFRLEVQVNRMYRLKLVRGYIKEKISYLQLPPEFSAKDFLMEFTCRATEMAQILTETSGMATNTIGDFFMAKKG